MKRELTMISIIVCAFMTFGSSVAQKKKVKIAYEFPDAMAQPVRDEYVKLCEKGRVLYEINCQSCHNTLVNKKLIIPDFTEEQLGAYSIRVANPKHEEHVSETNVSAEELALISAFLIYKKKNNPLVLIHNGMPHP